MGKGHKRQKSYAADLELPSVASNTHLPDLPKPKLRRSNRIEGIKSVHELEASVEVPDDDTQASSLYSDENITHHLGNLTPCRIVARPSKTIKSPYVADIIPLAGPHKGDVKLAHAPNLDCCMTVVPGSIVYCSENTNKLTKTQYAIQVCSDRVDMKDITLQEAEREYTYVG
ncbi:hypothetical protein EON65_30300 [archaeon]|nr:MAG: hypothetical protein EON65_30300 [archaeon]